MNKFVISDTNILIDLHTASLLGDFLALPAEVHTMDLVLTEIETPSIKAAVDELVREGVLLVDSITDDQMEGVLELMSGNLSITDCSVWFMAKKNGWTLLTGDKALRTKAQEDGVDVHGILHIFDVLVNTETISPSSAAEKLRILFDYNKRIPKEEVDKRLQSWESTNFKNA